MDKIRSTIKDVSKLANVSTKTVSRVINNDVYISKDTKKSVLDAIKKLNYKPNLIAKKLKVNKTNTIGYIIPDFTNQFFGMIFNGIDRVIKENNYNVLVLNSNGIKENEENCIDLLIQNNVEGIIFASTGLSGEYVKHQVEIFRIPFVLIDNKLKGVKMNCVLHDNVKGAEILTEHLMGNDPLGKIAFIAGPINETSSKKRLEGYQNILKKNNKEINTNLIKLGEWNNKSGYDLTKQLFLQHDKPSSIFIGSTSMALGVLKALHELKLRCPHDVKLVSFDDLEFTDSMEPSLTTLNRVEELIGDTAAKMLLNKIKEKDIENYDEVYIPLEIIIRDSSVLNNI
ncbi:MAG: LacI family DNA-binding transcriptional regulator [Candidatus Humimicrobiaceae bacterium]